MPVSLTDEQKAKVAKIKKAIRIGVIQSRKDAILAVAQVIQVDNKCNMADCEKLLDEEANSEIKYTPEDTAKARSFSSRADAVSYWYDEGLDLEYSHRATVIYIDGAWYLQCLVDAEHILYVEER